MYVRMKRCQHTATLHVVARRAHTRLFLLLVCPHPVYISSLTPSYAPRPLPHTIISQLAARGLALSGAAVDSMSEDALAQRVRGPVTVFFRTTPRHKMKIVHAFQRGGDVVAMTGEYHVCSRAKQQSLAGGHEGCGVRVGSHTCS